MVESSLGVTPRVVKEADLGCQHLTACATIAGAEQARGSHAGALRGGQRQYRGAADGVNRLGARARAGLVDTLALLLLSGLAILFFWPWFASSPGDAFTLPAGDFTDLHLPYRAFIARELANGRLPIWNPFVSAGHSSLGDIQFDIFYPITLAFSLWAGGAFTAHTLETQIVLHFALAGIFTYLFARRALSSPFGGLVAALAFTYGGYLTTFPVQQVIILQVSVWLPLVLLLLDLGFGHASPAWFVLGGLALAVAALAGHPQTLGYVCVAAAAYFAYRSYLRLSAPSGKAEWWFLPLVGSACLLVGLGAAAVQLLPALEHLALTSRTDVSYAFTSSGFALHELAGLALPSSQGGRSMYLGIVTLLLAAFGLCGDGAWASRRFWFAVALVATLVSFGGNTFLRGATYALVPGMQLFRNHERSVFLVSLAVALLAGYGAKRLLDQDESGSDVLAGPARLAAWLGVGVLALGVLFLYGVMVAAEAARPTLQELSDRAFFTALLLWLAAGLIYLRSDRKLHVSGWPVLMVALIVFDLFTTNWQNNLRPGDPQELFASPESLQIVQRDRSELFRVASEGLLPGDGNAGSLYGIYDVVGNSPLEVESYSQFTRQVDEWQRWRLLNVKYIFTKRELKDGRFALLNEDEGVRLYELGAEHRLPRAYVVHRARYADSTCEAIALTNAIDPSREVILEAAQLDSSRVDAAETGPSSVSIDSYDPQVISVSANLSTSGWLVLSEVYYPGWAATVDGKPVPVLRANGTLRAIPLEEGSHLVELRYSPKSLEVGRAASLVALGLSALIILREVLLRLRSRPVAHERLAGLAAPAEQAR